MSEYAAKVGRPFPYTDAQVTEMLLMWDAGVPAGAIARCFKGWPSTIKSIVERSGRTYEARNSSFRHYAWRGGRHVDAQGYVVVSVPPEWPWRREMARGRKYQVMEHRFVMAEHLGRALRSNETVHHIDGDRQNNRPENLQLRQGHHGAGVHYRCNHCGSQDVVPVKLGEAND